ncbi:MAG: hypothetical protein U0T75_06180 [Chitinophagales bacterium]
MLRTLPVFFTFVLILAFNILSLPFDLFFRFIKVLSGDEDEA